MLRLLILVSECNKGTMLWNRFSFRHKELYYSRDKLDELSDLYLIDFLQCFRNFTAGNLTRKRPLLGVPRSSMNPTKRTVMTLLARTKNAQALHTVRNPVTTPTPTHFAE